MSMRQTSSLQMKENMMFQAVEWACEVIGAILMVVLVVMTLKGAFGKDPHNVKVAGETNGPLWAKYERVARWQTRTPLEIHAMPSDADKRASVSINNSYLNEMMVNRIMPEPDNIESSEDRTTFIFSGSQRGSAVVARFHMEPEKPGKKHARISLNEERSVEFTQTIYP
jgi:hypothetical protein